MTHKIDRAERSKQRAIEHQQEDRRRRLIRYFALVLFLAFGVPLLWYSAVEFGLVQPIRTPELQRYLGLAQGLLYIAVSWLTAMIFFPKKNQEKSQPISAELKITKS